MKDSERPRRRHQPGERQDDAQRAVRNCRLYEREDRTDEYEARHALGVRARHFQGDGRADAMADEAQRTDPEDIDQIGQAPCVGVDRQRPGGGSPRWRIASAESEQVRYHDAVTRGNERNDSRPQVRGGGKTVNKQHGLAAAASPACIVVQPCVANVDELTTQGGSASSELVQEYAKVTRDRASA